MLNEAGFKNETVELTDDQLLANIHRLTEGENKLVEKMSEEITNTFNTVSELIEDSECFILTDDLLEIKNCEINFDLDFIEFCNAVSPDFAKKTKDEKDENPNLGKLYEINHNIKFDSVIFKKLIRFEGVIFYRKFEITNIQSQYPIEFGMCHFFYQYIELYEESPFKVLIRYIHNTPSILFHYCYFNSETYIIGLKLSERFIMESSEINKLVEICYIYIFNKDQQLLLENINTQVEAFVFSNINIANELRITNVENPLTLSLLNIKVYHEAILEIRDYNKKINNFVGIGFSDIKIHKSLINGTLIIKDSGFKYFEFEEVNVCGNIIESNITYGALSNIETVITLKNQAYKQSNITLYNKYRAEEQESLFKNSYLEPFKILIEILEGIRTISIRKLIKKKIKAILYSIRVFFFSMIIVLFSKEKILLWLNKYSNNFGLSWTRGIIFTISVAFIFYTLYFLSTNSVTWLGNPIHWLIFDSEYWKSVIEFIWLPDGLKELKITLNTSLWSYIWFILGKIFIAYGIYQTIVAFRKYGK